MELFFIVVNAWPPPLVIESVEYAESLSMSCCISGVIVGVVLLVVVLVFGLPEKIDPMIDDPAPIPPRIAGRAARNGILFSFELRFGESVHPYIRGLPAAERLPRQLPFALESQIAEQRAHGVIPVQRIDCQFADAFGEHLHQSRAGGSERNPFALEVGLENPMRGANPGVQTFE